MKARACMWKDIRVLTPKSLTCTIWIYFCGIIGLYIFWTKLEYSRITRKVKALLLRGFILVDGISKFEKRNRWRKYFLKLGLSQEVSTWPDTIREHMPGLPPLLKNNYEVQSIINYIYDPSFKKVNFGLKTHWKLRLLANPLWFFFPQYFQAESMTLDYDDQSWHIINIPTNDSFNLSLIHI